MKNIAKITGKGSINTALMKMEQLAEQNTEAIHEVINSLELNVRQMVKNSLGNYLKILQTDPLLKGSLRFNILTQRIDVVRSLWWNEEPIPLTDEGEDFICTYIEKFYHIDHEKNLKKALRVAANNEKYHPVRDYLEALQWDGKERIRYLLRKYLGSDDSELTYQSLLHFMLGAIRRVYQPGCKYEEMLCLVGGQGAGKSTFFRFLAIRDEWFSDDLKKLDDEKVYGKIRGHWIMEMSEMIAAISAKSNEIIKSFLSRQKETYRIPYQQYEEDRPRQCVFAGTTNLMQFIPFDRSGSRRFLPVLVNPEKAEKHLLADEAEARAYIDQAWAEAMTVFRSGNYSMKFSPEMQELLDRHRESFMQEDTLAGKIQAWLDGYAGDYVCSLQIYAEALDHPETEPKKYETNEICQIMQTKVTGWKAGPLHRFTKEGYGTQRSYVRVQGCVNEEAFHAMSKEERAENPFL